MLSVWQRRFSLPWELPGCWAWVVAPRGALQEARRDGFAQPAAPLEGPGGPKPPEGPKPPGSRCLLAARGEAG